MKKIFLMLILLLSVDVVSQKFTINDGKPHFKISFKQVNNLILIPLSVNGSFPMDFILDTGSPYTLITNDQAKLYFDPKKGEPISIRGLGKEQARLEAYLSPGNSVEVGSAFSPSVSIVILNDRLFDYSSYLGLPIYGIIGYDLMKDFVVKINYRNKTLHFYTPDYFYKKKNTRRYTELPLTLERAKPFIELSSVIGEQPARLRLLVDTGSTDSFWLFEKEEEDIRIPARNMKDNLGYGLNGEIMGIRGRVPQIEMGPHILKQPIVSFPDSLSVAAISRNGRNGSVGSEILRRFDIIYDYDQSRIFLKKNRFLKEDYQYNMSGMELIQPYLSLPYLEVVQIREDSPAEKAGLKPGDTIRTVNDRTIITSQWAESGPNGLHINTGNSLTPLQKSNLHEFISLSEIKKIFFTKGGRKVKVSYTRGDDKKEYKTEFILEEVL